MRGSRLTHRGLAFSAAGLGTVLLAAFAGQADLVWPGLFLLFVPLLSLGAVVVARPALDVTRRLLPPVVEVDQPVRVEVTVRATGTLPTTPAFAVDEPPRAVGAAHRFVIPALSPGTSATDAYVRRPRRRGRWRLDALRYEVTDVLGMARRETRAPGHDTLVVTPRVLPLAHERGSAFGRQGETPIPQTAVSGPDDVLVRDYLPRDDVRRIHWPSTARTGTLMVRREEQAWDPTAWVVLDSRAAVHPLTGDTHRSFEWLVSAAASVGCALLADGYEVSVTDAAGAVHLGVAPRAPGATTQLLEHLVDADLAEEGSLRLAGRAVAQAPSGHLVVALLARLDPETAHHLVAAHDAQQDCRALALPQPAAEHAFAAGRAILLDHGWAVTTCAIDGDLAAAWAAVSRPAGVSR